MKTSFITMKFRLCYFLCTLLPKTQNFFALFLHEMNTKYNEHVKSFFHVLSYLLERIRNRNKDFITRSSKKLDQCLFNDNSN